MRRFCLAAVMLILAGTGVAHGESVWGKLVNTSRMLKERYSDKLYLWNETDRVVLFKIRRGDGTIFGITEPVFPGQFSSRVANYPNPKVFDIRAFVWNERKQAWVAKTDWVRFRNPDPGEPGGPQGENWGDELYFLFYKTRNGFALDWL